MGSRTVKRIADVSKLRIYQFPQVLLFCTPLRPHHEIVSIFLMPNYMSSYLSGCWSYGASCSPPFIHQGQNFSYFPLKFLMVYIIISVDKYGFLFFLWQMDNFYTGKFLFTRTDSVKAFYYFNLNIVFQSNVLVPL